MEVSCKSPLQQSIKIFYFTHIYYINVNTICTGGDIMQSFNEYTFANVTDEERQMLTNLEQNMSKDESKKVILVAYENKSAES